MRTCGLALLALGALIYTAQARDVQTLPADMPATLGAPAIVTPTLTLPALVATPGSTVTLPVAFATGDQQIASLIFSLDYDQNQLFFDPVDANQDAIPDNIHLNVPGKFIASASATLSDTQGELDFFVVSLFVPPPACPLATWPPSPSASRRQRHPVQLPSTLPQSQHPRRAIPVGKLCRWWPSPV